MSEQVLSVGFMAALLETVDHETMDEKLANSLLRVNYDGTLVYINFADHDAIYGGVTLLTPDHLTQFHSELNNAGLQITHEVKPFASSWYNGTDSYMDEMSLEDFLKEE